MFKCELCGEFLKAHECIITHSDELCEIYVNCPYCGGECTNCKEDCYAKETC